MSMVDILAMKVKAIFIIFNYYLKFQIEIKLSVKTRKKLQGLCIVIQVGSIRTQCISMGEKFFS